MSHWRKTTRVDPDGRVLADRHYSRQKPGTKNFVQPGRSLVLLTTSLDAVWVTSWPFSDYVRHAWGGAWICSMFRNEGLILSSSLIREAVAHTRYYYHDAIPESGFITFIDAGKVKPKRDPGYCYLMAGFERIGKTKGGKICLHLSHERMPEPLALVDRNGAPVEPYSGSLREWHKVQRKRSEHVKGGR